MTSACNHHAGASLPSSPASPEGGPARAGARLTEVDQHALRALMARLSAADSGALRELYEATSGRLFGLAQHILGSAAAAEDVLLEVYVQVWKQAARYDPACGSVLAWLCTLTRTRAIDAYRARVRRARRESALEDHAAMLSDLAPGPFDSSAAADRAGVVQRAVSALPPDQRRAIEAAFFRGLTHTEVAEALQQPLGTVKTRIRTGLATLRRALAPVEEGLA
jgi:RNA polymerase sigma-70 factor (ECF subfamily)